MRSRWFVWAPESAAVQKLLVRALLEPTAEFGLRSGCSQSIFGNREARTGGSRQQRLRERPRSLGQGLKWSASQVGERGRKLWEIGREGEPHLARNGEPVATPRSPGPGCCANTPVTIPSHWPQSSVNRPACWLTQEKSRPMGGRPGPAAVVCARRPFSGRAHMRYRASRAVGGG